MQSGYFLQNKKDQEQQTGKKRKEENLIYNQKVLGPVLSVAHTLTNCNAG